MDQQHDDAAAAHGFSRRRFLTRMAAATGAALVPGVAGYALTPAFASGHDEEEPPPSNTTTTGANHGNNPSPEGLANGGVPSQGRGGSSNGNGSANGKGSSNGAVPGTGGSNSDPLTFP